MLFRTLFITLLLSFSNQLVANEKSQHGVGIGQFYGGYMGYQYSQIHRDNRYFVGVGLVGFSAGVEHQIDIGSPHSVGAVIGVESISADKGYAVAFYNYRPQGQIRSGLVVGGGIGLRRRDPGSFFADTGKTETKPQLMLTLGYQF